MAETNPSRISCKVGGRMHKVKEPRWWTRRLTCEDCGIVYVRDETWVQGWRPEVTQDEFQKITTAEAVARQQRDMGTARCVEWVPKTEAEVVLMTELHRLQAVVLGEAYPLPIAGSPRRPTPGHGLEWMERPADPAEVVVVAARNLLNNTTSIPGNSGWQQAPLAWWRDLATALGRESTL